MNLLYLYHAPSGDGESRVGFAITDQGVLLAGAQPAEGLQSAENLALYDRFFEGRPYVMERVEDEQHPGLKSALELMRERKQKSIDTLASRC